MANILRPLSSVNVGTPFGFWQAALVLKKVHRFWQFTIRVPSYTNPDNFFGLGVGYILNFALGENRLLKLPALPFLVGTRLLDFFEQEDAFRSSCCSWKEAVLGVQPITLIERLPSGELKSHLLPGISWRLKAKRLTIRIQRFANATFGLGKEGFKLLMRIMDLLDLMTLNPKNLQSLIDLGVQEGALNIPRCLKALDRNKWALIKRLEGKKETIDSLLKKLGAKTTSADTVIDMAQAAIQRLHEWNKNYEAIAKAVGGLFKGAEKSALIIPPPEVIAVPRAIC